MRVLLLTDKQWQLLEQLTDILDVNLLAYLEACNWLPALRSLHWSPSRCPKPACQHSHGLFLATSRWMGLFTRALRMRVCQWSFSNSTSTIQQQWTTTTISLWLVCILITLLQFCIKFFVLAVCHPFLHLMYFKKLGNDEYNCAEVVFKTMFDEYEKTYSTQAPTPPHLLQLPAHLSFHLWPALVKTKSYMFRRSRRVNGNNIWSWGMEEVGIPKNHFCGGRWVKPTDHITSWY